MRAIRPIEASKAAVCYVRNTSKPVVTVLPIKLSMIAKRGLISRQPPKVNCIDDGSQWSDVAAERLTATEQIVSARRCFDVNDAALRRRIGRVAAFMAR
jgi:hypothetical protein